MITQVMNPVLDSAPPNLQPKGQGASRRPSIAVHCMETLSQFSSCELESKILTRVYIGDYTREHYRLLKGDTTGVDAKPQTPGFLRGILGLQTRSHARDQLLNFVSPEEPGVLRQGFHKGLGFSMDLYKEVL